MDRALTKRKKARLDKIIGQNIRRERDLHKMSREELAEALDLTVSHMGLIERGERGATAVTLEKLSQVFNIQIDTLFAEPDKKTLAVKEVDRGIGASRKKTTAMLNRLNERETEFLAHVLKGLISYRPGRYENIDEYDDE